MAICAWNGLSLCSGYDGIGLGLELVLRKYRTVCHVEREAYAAAILAARMEDKTMAQAPVWSDLTTFDGKPWRGCVDIVTAGFPCQPWSEMGSRKGERDKRFLWPDVSRIVREVGPSVIFLENVRGFLKGGIPHVLKDLAEMGFNAEWGLFQANRATGAPHRRQRVFILAHSSSVGLKAIGQAYNEYREDESRDIVDGRCTFPDCQFEIASVWPPTVDRVEEWEQVSCESPEASAWEDLDDLCGSSARTSPWVDRARLTGNGVVPVMAAYAFLSLAKRAIED